MGRRPGDDVRGGGRDPEPAGPDESRRSSRLLPLLLVVVLLLGGGYLVKTQLLDSDDDEGLVATPRRTPVASAPGRATPTARTQAYSRAQIQAALQDPHFRHGYEAGKARAARGAVADRESACREMGLQERAGGYAWGAHDRQGCLVGLTP